MSQVSQAAALKTGDLKIIQFAQAVAAIRMHPELQNKEVKTHGDITKDFLASGVLRSH